jgi:hypothetical protein
MDGGWEMRTKKLFLLSAIVMAACAGFVPAAMAGADPGTLHAAAGLTAPVVTSGGYRAVEIKNTFGEYPDPRVLRVISLIEKKTDNQKVLAQIRHKLTNIGEERLRMISSLSERLVSKGPEAESEVAFLLLTALIIFS